MAHHKIAIIGGGLSGLYAALLLHRAGVDFYLIEARDRLGGRILTTAGPGAPTEGGFDLGPSWFWPNSQPSIKAVIEAFGLTTFSQHSDGDVIFERMSREPPHRYQSTVEGNHSMRIAGGTFALVHAIVDALPPENLQLGERVRALSLSNRSAQIETTDSTGDTRTCTADHIILALPPRLAAASIAFTPAHPDTMRQRWRETPTWMAPHAKFVAVYEHAFWRRDKLSGTAQSMIGPMAEIHDATTAFGQAALFGFLGIAAAQRSAMGEPGLRDACIEQFTRVFGGKATTPLQTFFKDWAQDNLTATPDDLASTGHIALSSGKWVIGPWEYHLTLAGSEASPSEPGYLEGAIVAAEIAVSAAVENIRVIQQQ